MKEDFILIGSGAKDTVLTADELAFCEAAAVSEMYAECLRILQVDASALYSSAWNVAMGVEGFATIPVAIEAKELADKITAMRVDMQRYLDPIQQRDSDTSRERQHASQH